MQITEENGPSGGRYIARLEGAEAEMTFSRASPTLIIIDHTGVPDALRGKGVGQAWRFTPSRRHAPAAGRSSRSARSSRPRPNATRTGGM
jgi:hypothetical protein